MKMENNMNVDCGRGFFCMFTLGELDWAYYLILHIKICT